MRSWEDLTAPELLWQAIEASSAPVVSLTAVIANAQSFRALFVGLPQHTPSLRFLGVNCADGYALAWTPAPDERDLHSLRSMENLELIRWQARILWGNLTVPAIQLATSQWHPAVYSGPALKHVQHELKYYEEEPKGHEGSWERADVGTDGWKIRHSQFVAPRRDFKNESLVR